MAKIHKFLKPKSSGVEYDVIVVGGGTAGYSTAIALARHGKRVLVIEKDRFGGVCVNYGCVPSVFVHLVSKALTRVPSDLGYLGLQAVVEADRYYRRMVETRDYLAEAGRKLVENAGADVEMGEAEVSGPSTVRVNGKEYEFERLVLATGSVPRPLDVPGGERALSEDQAFLIKDPPSSMVVIGGGYAGVEIAQAFGKLGTQVTLLTRSRVLERLQLSEETRKVLLDSLSFDNVEVKEFTEPKRIDESGRVETTRGEFKGEIVVAAVGRKPNYPKGLEKLGVETNGDGVKVNDRMETTNPRVFAVGDVVSKGFRLANAALMEGLTVAANLALSIDLRVDYSYMPQVVFSDPNIGVVGRRDLAVKFLSYPNGATTRSVVEGKREGHVILGLDGGGRIVYGEAVGENAEAVVNTLALAIKLKARVEDLAFVPFVHPSMTEALSNTARAFYNFDIDQFK